MEEHLKSSQQKIPELLDEDSKSNKHPSERLNDENILRQIEARLEGIKALLTLNDVQLLKEVQSRPKSLDSATKTEQKIIPDDRFKQTLVEVMSLSLQYWIQTTKKTKIELAEESRLWAISASRDGIRSTRTLDRYLSLKSLPPKPRWQNVLQTARFVLQNCPNTAADLKTELLQKRLTLEKYFVVQI